MFFSIAIEINKLKYVIANLDAISDYNPRVFLSLFII